MKAFLLCDEVDVNNNYDYEKTPLYIASREGHEDIVHVLLKDPRQGLLFISYFHTGSMVYKCHRDIGLGLALNFFLQKD